jgi:hypothetical protein
MQLKTIIITLLASLLCIKTNAQQTTPIDTKNTISGEKYGHTLNAGVGIGYYGYVGYNIPVIHADFEFQIGKNLTIAPSITFYNYHRNYYWGDRYNNYGNYYYRETVIPIGIKTTYYFDQLLNANKKWDFYAAGSLGFIYRRTTWDYGYDGETNIQPGTGYLYLDFHIGTEYHLNNKVGLQLDLSTGVSTFGLAFHF